MRAVRRRPNHLVIQVGSIQLMAEHCVNQEARSQSGITRMQMAAISSVIVPARNRRPTSTTFGIGCGDRPE